MLRSDIRNACHRLKKDGPLLDHQVDLKEKLEEILLPGDTWKNFTEVWDIIVKDGKIIRVGTELEESFINDLCVSIRTKLELGQDLSNIEAGFDSREQNVYDVIQLNYLGQEVDWSKYKKTWNTSIDWERKQIEVFSMKTKKSQPKPTPKKSLKEAIKDTIDDEDALVEKIKHLLKQNKE